MGKPKVDIVAMVRARRDMLGAKLKEMSEHSGLDKTKNPFPSECYSVVIADCNSGMDKKGSTGDEVAWSLPDFQGFSGNVKDANKADTYVVIVFLHHDQGPVSYSVYVFLWHCLNVMCV